MSDFVGNLRATALAFRYDASNSSNKQSSKRATPALRVSANEFVPPVPTRPIPVGPSEQPLISIGEAFQNEPSTATMNADARQFRPGDKSTKALSSWHGSLSLDAAATCFVPPQHQCSKSAFRNPTRSTPVCRFFSQGACRHGLDCRFSHDLASHERVSASRPDIGMEQGLEKVKVDVTETSKVVDNGIRCQFGPGLEVLKLELGEPDFKQQDCKQVLISGLGLNTTDYDLETRLSTFGTIHSINRKENASYAVCCFEGSKEAADAVDALNGTPQGTWSGLAMAQRPSCSRRGKNGHSGFVSVTIATAGSPSTSSRMATVKVHWYAPSRVAWLHFHKRSQAEAAAKTCHMKRFTGRTVSAKMQKPSFNQTRSFSVWLGGLGETVKTDQLIKWVLKTSGAHPASIDVEAPPFRDDEGATKVRQLLISKGGALAQFDEDAGNRHSPHVLKRRALAKFTKAADAARACAFFQQTARIPELGGTRVFCHRVFSAKYSITEPIFRVIQGSLTEALQGYGEDVRHRFFYNDTSNTASLLLQCDDPKQLATVKSEISSFVDGQLVLDPACKHDQKIPLWRDCFCSRETERIVIDKVGQKFGGGSVVVLFQKRRRQVRLFTGPLQSAGANKFVSVLLSDIRPDVQAVPIAPSHFKFLLAGGRETLDRLITASHVTISLNIKSQSLLVEGTPKDARRAAACLNRTMSGGDPIDGEANPCPVCFCPSEGEPFVQLQCMHTYCEDCFLAWLGGLQTCNFPISCLADGCDKAIATEELGKVLPRSDFLRLLRSSVDKHVVSNQSSLQFCLSPGCSGIYEVPLCGDERTATCSTCQMVICCHCKTQDHEGLSCEQHKLTRLPPHVHQLRNHIIEEVLTLKCPRCKQAFLDFDGCFALKCGSCPCGFCGWCLEDCGGDAHAHVKSCPSKPIEARNETYFGTAKQFEEAQRQRRQKDLKSFLLPMSTKEKDQVLKVLDQDLKDLKLTGASC